MSEAQEPSAPVAPPPRSWQKMIAWQDEVTRRDESAEDNAWLVTYLDMLTLLLTLFVVMLAYSSFRPDRFTELTEAVRTETASPAAQHPAPEPPSAAQRLADQFAVELERAGLLEDVAMRVEDLRLTLQIQERILFSSGSAELNAQGESLLAGLVPMFQAPGRLISVEGHTDDVPIRTAQFPSNWELSAARASRVVRHLVEQGVPAPRLRAIGYGETRPVEKNETAEGRASNRRVALVIDLAAAQGN